MAIICLYSLMDKIQDSDSCDKGSIPFRDTILDMIAKSASSQENALFTFFQVHLRQLMTKHLLRQFLPHSK